VGDEEQKMSGRGRGTKREQGEKKGKLREKGKGVKVGAREWA